MSYEVGKIVKGRITGIQPYGAFVSLDDYYNGLIHISEISHGFVKNIEDYLKVGETIYVKVIEVDNNNEQLKLSIKDIKYRIKTSPFKRNRRYIKETYHGFDTLQKKLPMWIENAKNTILND